MKKVLISVAVALTLATVGCSDDAGDDSGELGGKVTGAEGTLGESTITTWAEMDENGQVSHVGFTAGAAGIDKLAEDAHLALEWPEEVQTQTFFNHLGLDFLKEGHPPAPYLHAHFDIHFYGIDKATVDAIDCANEPLPRVCRRACRPQITTWCPTST